MTFSDYHFLVEFPWVLIPFFPPLFAMLFSSFILVTHHKMSPGFGIFTFVRFLALSEFLANAFQILVTIIVMLVENDWVDKSYSDEPSVTLLGISLPLWLAMVVTSFVWTMLLVWYPISPPEPAAMYRYHIIAWAVPIILFAMCTILGINGISFQLQDYELCQGMWLNVCMFYPLGFIAWVFVLLTLFGVAILRRPDRFSLNTVEASGLTPEEVIAQNAINKRLVLEYGIVFLIVLALPLLVVIVRFASHRWTHLSPVLFYFITACLLPLRGICNAVIIMLFPSVQGYFKGAFGNRRYAETAEAEELTRMAI